MPKTYYGQGNSGHHEPVDTPPASGPVKIMVYKGATLGNVWDYSGAVNGTTTLYLVDNGPTLGRERSAT